MTNTQAGSRWEISLAIERCLQQTLQLHADRESQRLASVVGELQGDDYAGDGVMLAIPEIVSVALKMDEQAHPVSHNCPAVYVSGIGDTTFVSAVSTIPQQAMASTTLSIAAYVTTRAVYQGTVYRLTERELIFVAGALAGALTGALRGVGIGSVWAASAGITNTTVQGIRINGHAADDGKTSAAKVLLSVVVDHEMRY